VDQQGFLHATGAVRNVVERLSDEIWQLAEVSFHEGASSRAHLRELEAAGFTITSRGTGGIPTAFVAEWTQAKMDRRSASCPSTTRCPASATRQSHVRSRVPTAFRAATGAATTCSEPR
jgi:hypothetical protein